MEQFQIGGRTGEKDREVNIKSDGKGETAR